MNQAPAYYAPDALWKCGHPMTAENTQSVGSAGVRCRECRRRINREHALRKASKRIGGPQ